ncbi:MAG TPA: phosphoribosylformylglycinamidine synthase subunit PurL, partial [Bacteroidia bacterium]|nr:phosphoribosylformylglycinamidine synthase subunit PurL [Bacteroidia bacterium]
GNPVYIVGSATGKDGIHGATFASGDLHEDSHEDLPAVQVGDPFTEKLLLEASLEVIASGAVIGMQDMGAAGIICSTSEMSAKGKHGMVIHLDQVPTRQKGMLPWEILLSESQERMLVVAKKGMEKIVEKVFEKWDLNCVLIGEVTEGERLHFYIHGERVADVPAESLVLGGGAPVYEREFREPKYITENSTFKKSAIPVPENLKEVALSLLANPNIASKKWITTQYDSMVGTVNMTTNEPSDAAVINIKDTDKALAFTVDCNARYVYSNPETGAAIAVAEAARNIICAGGEPVAITNCLNFGNPYNPEVFWQFVNAIKGMGDACRKFNTPVTGGNVSFYNQSVQNRVEVPVFPTPTIGMLGVLRSKKDFMTLYFKKVGDIIYLLGESKDDIACSEYLYSVHGVKNSPAPAFNLDEEVAVQQSVLKLIREGLIKSAHDVSDGGLFIALAEAGMHRALGFDISSDESIRKDAFLFGEAQSRVVVTVSPDKEDAFLSALDDANIEFSTLGEVATAEIRIDGESFGTIAEVKHIYENAIGVKMAE